MTTRPATRYTDEATAFTFGVPRVLRGIALVVVCATLGMTAAPARANESGRLSREATGGWKKCEGNPIIAPGRDQWDHDACYKPYAIYDGTKWLLWYNGRRGSLEQIGVAFHEGLDLKWRRLRGAGQARQPIAHLTGSPAGAGAIRLLPDSRVLSSP